MKYIDAERLSKKIERIGLFPQRSADYNDGRIHMKMIVLGLIDSLQQEQVEVDFEEEWEKFEKRVEIYNLSDYSTCYEPKQIARHFYELGLKARNARKED